MKPVPDAYGRRLAKLNVVLERLGDVPIIDGIRKLWGTEDSEIRQAFLELSGWEVAGWVLVEWSRLPRSLKEDLVKERVLDSLRRAEELLKKSSSDSP
jgi:hypothetical protein